MASYTLESAGSLPREQEVSAPSSAGFSYPEVPSPTTQAPKDELTGLPLPIYYGPQHLNLPRNYQHGWHSDRRLREGLPISWAMALRASMGYLIPVKFHEEPSAYGYHRAIKDGPALPTNMDDVFSAVALGIAGVVPRNSINLTKVPGEFSILELNNRQYKFIANPRRAYSEKEFHKHPGRQQSRDKIGRFFAEYSILRGLQRGGFTPIEEEAITDSEKPLTRELGWLVYKASKEALLDLMPPVVEKFKAAKKAGMVNRKTDLRSRILSYVPEHHFGSYLDDFRGKQLTDGLSLQTGVDEVVLEAA